MPAQRHDVVDLQRRGRVGTESLAIANDIEDLASWIGFAEAGDGQARRRCVVELIGTQPERTKAGNVCMVGASNKPTTQESPKSRCVKAVSREEKSAKVI